MHLMRYLFAIVFLFTTYSHADNLVLKNNLQHAKIGDYLVISSNKTNTVMHIYDKQGQYLIVEEIAVPESRSPKMISWKEWVQESAPGNTSWVMYEIDLQTGKMLRYYSFTKNGWFEIAEADNFLSKLLALNFSPMPENLRKKIPPRPFSGEGRQFWQPPMIVDGQLIRGVQFDAWRTKWPKDGSDLSGKVIDVYLPQDNQAYPSYFPYWLQINGVAGKARVRMIDSGSNMKSPKPAVMRIGAGN